MTLRLPTAAAVLAALVATAGLAHSGVTNPAVMARMEAMTAISAEVKTLTKMARGEVPFDPDAVAASMGVIAAQAAQVPVLFEAPETDPASEAAPTIWTSYPDFTARAAAMGAAARAGAGAADPAALEAALGELAQTCRSCHGAFKLQ